MEREGDRGRQTKKEVEREGYSGRQKETEGDRGRQWETEKEREGGDREGYRGIHGET